MSLWIPYRSAKYLCRRASARVAVACAALALYGSGCTRGQLIFGFQLDCRISGTEPRLVHIVGLSGLRAGTPIDSGHLVATLEQLDHDGFYELIADGAPINLSGLTKYRAVSPMPYQTTRFPRAGVFQDRTRQTCNSFCPGWTLAIGQPVSVAGYFLRDGQDSLPQFLSAPVAVVEAQVITPMEFTDAQDHEHLIWLSVPCDDYRAFAGGPVLVERPDGSRCVVAIVLFQSAETTPDGRAILAAMPTSVILT